MRRIGLCGRKASSRAQGRRRVVALSSRANARDLTTGQAHSDTRECPSVRAGLAVSARLGMMGERTSEDVPSLVSSQEPSVETGLALAARLGMTEDASLLAAATTLSSAVATVVPG